MQNRGILVEKKDGVDPWTHEPKAGDYVTDLKLTDVGKTRALQPDEVLIKVKVKKVSRFNPASPGRSILSRSKARRIKIEYKSAKQSFASKNG